MTQSPDFQLAEIAWKNWRGLTTWFHFFKGNESFPLPSWVLLPPGTNNVTPARGRVAKALG